MKLPTDLQTDPPKNPRTDLRTNFQWNSLLGHEKQILRLKKILREHRLPHAVLFSGPAGIGKRRVAEVLAAALLCTGEDTPCGRCESCRAMQNGQHPDFYLLEPESSGKTMRSIQIEKIREMQSEIARLPLLSGCRVILIDDAHRMNEMAENSLLKTLEEPTGQVYFLLVTHAASFLLDTIRSRCTPMHFAALPQETVQKALRERGASEAQARELAILSDGSLGHAIHLLKEDALSLRNDALSCLESMPTLSPEQIFTEGKRFAEMPKEQLMEWLGYQSMLLRDILVLSKDGGSTKIYHNDVRERLLMLLASFPESRVFRMLTLLREIQYRLQSNVNLRLLMEGMLFRWRRLFIGGPLCKQ